MAMTSLFAFALASAVQAAEVDPNRLNIGREGTDIVQPGQLYDLRTNKACTMGDIVKASEGKRFVYIGEQHATKAHQQMEADVVKALSETRKRIVIVGLEMFQRPKQDVLDRLSNGTLGVDALVVEADWKGQWGYDFELYRPIFNVVHDRTLQLVGLNVPRDWVRSVSKGGYENLPTTAALQLPPKMYLGNKLHRQVFDALVGPHNMPGVKPDNMYAAQVLWDEAMADTALKYLAAVRPDHRAQFVVVAGAGHMMYGQGINYRVARRKGGSGINLAMIESDSPVTVSRGIADFVYVSPKPQSANK